MGNSFYGGQDARPFIIKKKFDSVQDMTKAFKKGIAYLDVNFEDYVLINCLNKNNPENGKIFRRGYDIGSGREISYYKEKRSSGDNPIVTGFQKDKTPAYGAEYIGDIVGPSGEAPLVELQAGLITEDQRNSIYEILGDDIVEGTNVSYNELEFNKDNMVSGEGTDTISWNHLCTKTKENNETKMLIGFKIPYPVFKMSAEHVSTYNDEDGNIKTFLSEDLLSDNASYRIYLKDWKLKIPKGIKGDSTKIELIGSTENNNQQIKITNTNYDKNINGTSEYTTFDYNVIDSISFSEKGFLTIGMTSKSDFINNDNPIIWIKNINLNANNGEISLEYNNSDIKPKSTLGTLNWIKNASFDNGLLKFTFVNSNGIGNGKTNIIQQEMNWIESASFSNDGLLNLTFNNNSGISANYGEDTIQQYITWITGASIDPDSGVFNLTFNNNKVKDINETLKFIKDVSLNDNGTFKVDYTTGDSFEKAGVFKSISNVEMLDNFKLQINYNNGEVQTLNTVQPQSIVFSKETETPTGIPTNSVWIMTKEVEEK